VEMSLETYLKSLQKYPYLFLRIYHNLAFFLPLTSRFNVVITTFG
jgi:hypothetical protein